VELTSTFRKSHILPEGYYNITVRKFNFRIKETLQMLLFVMCSNIYIYIWTYNNFFVWILKLSDNQDWNVIFWMPVRENTLFDENFRIKETLQLLLFFICSNIFFIFEHFTNIYIYICVCVCEHIKNRSSCSVSLILKFSSKRVFYRTDIQKITFQSWLSDNFKIQTKELYLIGCGESQVLKAFVFGVVCFNILRCGK
jgi:hypothetical protein